MNSTNKELLQIPFPKEPGELFKHIGKLLARLDKLKHEKKRYLHGFKYATEDISTFEEFEIKIINGLSELYLLSFEKDFFWFDCPLKVYKNTFSIRLKELSKRDPELTENGLLTRDYQVLDNYPLFEQRFLRNDNTHSGIDYGQLLHKRKEDDVNTDLLQEAENLKHKLERSRKEKMNFIQEKFQEQGKRISKNGFEFELVDLLTPVRTVEVSPRHSHIFANKGFILFDHLMEKYIHFDKRGWKSNLAYFYRRLEKERFIHCNIKEFQNWFNSIYDKDPGQIKTISNISEGSKRQNYSDAIEWLKSQ